MTDDTAAAERLLEIFHPYGTQPMKDVRAVARGGDSDDDIVQRSERFNLTGKDGVESEIICARREDGRVRGEGNRRQGAAVATEADDKLRGDMLRIRSAASIPEDQDLSARIKAANDPLREIFDEALLCAKPLDDGKVIGQMRADDFGVHGMLWVTQSDRPREVHRA